MQRSIVSVTLHSHSITDLQMKLCPLVRARFKYGLVNTGGILALVRGVISDRVPHDRRTAAGLHTHLEALAIHILISAALKCHLMDESRTEG